jgi:hypothetical protein
MIYIIIVSLIVISGLSFFYAKSVESNPDHPYNNENKEKKEIKVSNVADNPIGFGYKTTWLAIKSKDQEQIANVLGLNEMKKSNWKSGLDNANDKHIFITPSIEDWTLVIGESLPSGDSEESLEKVKSLLERISNVIGEAQFFSTYRTIEFHCWIKSTNGFIDRLYSYIGESGENIAVFGEATEIEKKYNLFNSFSKDVSQDDCLENNTLIFPNEELVMEIAKAWSINPTTLDDRQDIKGLGLLGLIR